MANRNNEEVKFEIHEILGTLNEGTDGWKREVTVTSWNGGPAKIDIRSWSEDHERMTRGITLFEDEAQKLADILKQRY